MQVMVQLIPDSTSGPALLDDLLKAYADAGNASFYKPLQKVTHSPLTRPALLLCLPGPAALPICLIHLCPPICMTPRPSPCPASLSHAPPLLLLLPLPQAYFNQLGFRMGGPGHSSSTHATLSSLPRAFINDTTPPPSLDGGDHMTTSAAIGQALAHFLPVSLTESKAAS